MRKGCTINPIFAVSGITLEIFRIDWLHAVDLGVGADFLGNLLWMIAEKMPAPNQDSRVKLLQTEVNNYYAAHGIKDQIKKITKNTIRPDAKDPPQAALQRNTMQGVGLLWPHGNTEVPQ